AQRIVGEYSVHAFDPVDDLGDAQVDGDAGKRQRPCPIESQLPPHQVEHGLERQLGGAVEVLVESERDPALAAAGDRHLQVEVVPDVDGQLGQLQRALDGGAADLSVTLGGMGVSG